MKWLGLDVASTTGYAFMGEGDAGPVWQVGTCRADSIQKYDVLAMAIDNGVTHACMEAPLPFTGSHASTASSMNRSYGRWLEACDVKGIIVVPTLVKHWQPHMLVINGVSMKQGKCKSASLAVAKLYGAHCINGDEADAVCIALYGPHALVRNAAKDEEKKATAKAKAKARKAK